MYCTLLVNGIAISWQSLSVFYSLWTPAVGFPLFLHIDCSDCGLLVHLDYWDPPVCIRTETSLGNKCFLAIWKELDFLKKFKSFNKNSFHGTKKGNLSG